MCLVGKMKNQERKGVACFVAFVVISAMVVQSKMEEEPLLAYLVESGLINLEMVYSSCSSLSLI